MKRADAAAPLMFKIIQKAREIFKIHEIFSGLSVAEYWELARNILHSSYKSYLEPVQRSRKLLRENVKPPNTHDKLKPTK